MVETSDVGKKAEAEVAKTLVSQGHQILSQNWRRPRCEIDVISKKDKVVYFTEVKYRSSQNQGEGFDYITATKHKQMERAAQMWVNENDWSGECQLMAASVSGQAFDNIDIVEI